MNSSIDAERYLVTGSSGCIGAWVVRELLADHAHVVAYDLATDSHRMSMILNDIDITALVRVQADITDLDRLERTLDEHGITRVVHLAALQVPFCRANPPGGASVNVVGTANVFEAVAHRLEMIPHVVFASSIAAYDAFVPGVAPAMNATPSTVYGVYKRATEQMAELYFADRGVPSIALRPHTIYGPGRDQGLTSGPTLAMLAVAAGREFVIPYTGSAQFQHAQDAARVFIQAAQGKATGASRANLAGQVASIAEIVELVQAHRHEGGGQISAAGPALAFPDRVPSDDVSDVVGAPTYDRPLRDGIADTISRFGLAIRTGQINPAAVIATSA